MIEVGSVVLLPGLADICEVAWVVGDVAGVRVPWQREAFVIGVRYLRLA